VCRHETNTPIVTVHGRTKAKDPDGMAEIAKAWNKLAEAIPRKLLPTILRRVLWHHADQEITNDLVADAAERLW
tara:strand:- start:134 stop:355 length:222 start_codon:yes stop_codon:yes gene_type:complete